MRAYHQFSSNTVFLTQHHTVQITWIIRIGNYIQKDISLCDCDLIAKPTQCREVFDGKPRTIEQCDLIVSRPTVFGPGYDFPQFGNRMIRSKLLDLALFVRLWGLFDKNVGAQENVTVQLSLSRTVAANTIDVNTWLHRILERKPRLVVAIALANRMARRLWAMLVKKEDYRDPVIVGAYASQRTVRWECEEVCEQ